MAIASPPHEEFHTWAEIAGYLNISVREAQNREKNDGMPVHRLPGKKPRVWAYRAELDAWMSRTTSAGNDSAAAESDTQNPARSGTEQIPDAAGPSRQPPITRRLVIATLGVAAAAAYTVTTIARRRSPERAVTSGNLLTALDALGRTMWTYRFAGTPRYDSLLPWQMQVLDFEGRGRRGVLVAQNFIPAPGADQSGQGELFYFDADGNLKWTLPAQPDLLDFNGQPFEPVWNYGHMIVTPSRDGHTIWAAVRHSFRWPGCVLRVNLKGKARVHFANAGNVEHLSYLQREDGDFIAFSGENNAFDRSCAGLIGIDDAAAVSPPSDLPRYRFANGPQGGARSYLLFPTVELDTANNAPYGHASQIYRHPGGVVVEAGLGPAYLQYELSEKFEPLNVIPSGSYPNIHRRFEQQGVLKHSWEECPERKKPLTVRRFVSGVGWRNDTVPWRVTSHTS